MGKAVTIVAIEMGYGHLRPAHALAGEIGGEVLECDRAPLAPPGEELLWARVRRFYEGLSRVASGPWGRMLGSVLDNITHIPPLHPSRDLSAATAGVRGLDWMIDRGLGAGLTRWLDEKGASLLTTFYAPAVAADRLGARGPVFCVVTDSDINRVWVPLDPARSKVQFLAPSPRVVRRLGAYGVPRERISYTGFPLPGELIGGRDRLVLRKNLAERLVRLDPSRSFIGPHQAEIERWLGPLPEDQKGRTPHIVFAIGGAGAQVNLAEGIVSGLRAPLGEGRLRLTLVAGIRAQVAERFRATIDRLGVGGVDVLLAPDIPSYLKDFNRLLGQADVLWTKPSEMSFFAALGLPIVFSPPVGAHEAYNRRWVIESGGGLAQREPDQAAGWLDEWLADGTLAAAAWSGATRLPNLGLYAIADAVRADGHAL